jgi:hypothetical protein
MAFITSLATILMKYQTRKVLIILLLTITNQVFCQKNLFDTLVINSTTKIIGRYPQYDASKTFEKYNFVIEDSATIMKFIQTIRVGKEIPNSGEEPNFRLTVVKNYDEIGTWSISPNLKTVMTHDGHSYKFDINQIVHLNEKYPFKYYYEKVFFKNLEEYNEYLERQKSNPNFLFDYSPEFKYEGSFEIEFEKSDIFSSPRAISDFLEPNIEKIVDKDDYSLTYIVNKKNKEDLNQFTLTISGSKKLFEELKIENHKNKNWKPTLEDGWFFYRE